MQEGAERGRVESLGRLENGLRQAGDWYLWGPYVSERQWGTVREDYSAHGTAWEYLPHDHARSRAYRWGEDGLAGFCDVEQRLCLGLALWNGRDPILKERIFGLTGNQGNHGEDAKEYWWYLDATPSHSWNRWRYHYPQAEFPYARLVEENARRDEARPRVRADGHGDLRRRPLLDRRGALREGRPVRRPPDRPGHERRPGGGHAPRAPDRLVPQHVGLGGRRRRTRAARRRRTARASRPSIPSSAPLELVADDGPGRRGPELLFCDNETNDERLFGTAGAHRVPEGRDQRPRRVGRGRPSTRRARARRRHSTTASPSRRARRSSCGSPASAGDARAPWADFADVVDARRREADEFYAELTPPACSRRRGERDAPGARRDALGQAALLLRRPALAQRRPDAADAAESRHGGRNAHWLNFEAFDIMSMPDPWEYPWFAAWDSAFHCVALAHVDPAFAKYQLTLLCREWFQHPNGALPAYEWAFDDVNPPVQAWAALQVFVIDGGRDVAFLSRVFDKLLRQLHVVGEPARRRRLERVRGRLPRPRQHRRRSTARTCRAATCSSRRTRRAGWRRTR